MMDLLVLKERIKEIYEKYGRLIRPLLKFFIGMLIFFTINNNIGYNHILKNIIIVI